MLSFYNDSGPGFALNIWVVFHAQVFGQRTAHGVGFFRSNRWLRTNIDLAVGLGVIQRVRHLRCGARSIYSRLKVCLGQVRQMISVVKVVAWSD